MAVSSKTPVVALVGRPNVGKSTLFNRLVGRRQAITHETAGTTRDAVTAGVDWGKHHFLLIDTAGHQKPSGELETLVQEQLSGVVGVADVIVVVSDAGHMVTAEDQRAATMALKSRKPVILAINKVDTAAGRSLEQFKSLGIKDRIEVSAIHGRGTGDLLDAITAKIKAAPAPKEEAGITLALLGRPNVGKSSLLNSLGGKQQAIVSAEAGTTRDIGSIEVKFSGQPVEILDTAGLRRRGKIDPGIEKFSTLRTIASIAACDIAVLIMDAEELSVAGDHHIAGLVKEAGKGLILVVNKWDKIEKDDKTQTRAERRIQRDFQFVWWAPLLFTSAVTGLNVAKLLQLADQIQERRQQKITTPKLNRVIEALTTKHPPAGLKNRQPKINYATQVGTQPPTFAIFSTYPQLIHFSYLRFLENGLRDAFDFTGTPIVLEFRDKRKAKA